MRGNIISHYFLLNNPFFCFFGVSVFTGSAAVNACGSSVFPNGVDGGGVGAGFGPGLMFSGLCAGLIGFPGVDGAAEKKLSRTPLLELNHSFH